MTRLKRFQPRELSPEQSELYEGIVARVKDDAGRVDEGGRLDDGLNLRLVNPAIGQAIETMISALYNSTSVTPRCREIAIMLTADRARCKYELAHHTRSAKSLNLVGENAPELASASHLMIESPAEQATAEFVSSLLDSSTVSAELLESSRTHLDDAELFELASFVGFYTMIAYTLNAFAAEPADWK